jgi:hypothetical protein
MHRLAILMPGTKSKKEGEKETIEAYRHWQELLVIKNKCLADTAQYTNALPGISDRYVNTEAAVMLKAMAFDITDMSRESEALRALDTEIREKVSAPIAKVAKEFESKLTDDAAGKEVRQLFYAYLEDTMCRLTRGAVSDRAKHWIKEEMKDSAVKEEKRG